MTRQPDIYAVLWTDMVPLSLFCASPDDAIQKARDINAKAATAGVKLHRLRAVHCTGADQLINLWEAHA